jgi:hypothetical protein
MSVSAPFTPTGNTVVIAVTTSASSAVQVPSASAGGNQYRIINGSTTQSLFLSYGQTAAIAQANCVIPTAGNSTTTLYVLPNTDEILTFVPGAYFAAITSANTATLYIVPGDGD